MKNNPQNPSSPACASKPTTGERAEQYAAHYLHRKGFTIERKNMREKRAEVDLVARKGDLLIFVEVKFRSNLRFGPPESFVTSKQQERYHEAATAYMMAIDWEQAIRFDIISLEKRCNKLHLTHFEDAF